MDADWIITAFVLIDTVLEQFDHRSHVLADVPDSEVVIVAVIAAKYFQNHHERALCIVRELGYLSGHIEISRFNRRLHALHDWLAFLAVTLGELFLQRAGWRRHQGRCRPRQQRPLRRLPRDQPDQAR